MNKRPGLPWLPARARLAQFAQRAGGAAGLLALVLAAAGCLSKGTKAANPPATAGAPANAKRYKVLADATPFYKYGPQQPNGPDLKLRKDTELTLVKRSFGFSEVTVSDGETGYVGTEDITPLTAEDLAAEAAAQQQMAAAAAGMPSSGAVKGVYTIPPGAGNDERLPVADPSPAGKPSPPAAPFRY